MGQLNFFKITSYFLALFLFIFPILQPKPVKAIAVIDDLAALAIVGLCLTAYGSAKFISPGYSITPQNLSGIKAKISEGGETVIKGVNALGNAIKSGADKATVQALATGSTIYIVLNAIHSTIFPSRESIVEDQFSNYKLLYENSTRILSYNSPYSNYFDGGFPILEQLSFSTTSDFNYFRITNIIGILPSNAYIEFPLFNKTTGKFIESFVTGGYQPYGRSRIFIYDGISNCISLANSKGTIIGYAYEYFKDNFSFALGNTYKESVKDIVDAPSVSLPVTLPQTIIDNINNWDGTQALVLAPPIPWDIPSDDLIIVTPTTGEGTVNPPIDPPDIDTPFPWLETALGAILAGEFFTGLDSSLKTASKALGDVINPTITALEKTITDSLTGIQTQVGDIGKTVTEIGSNILAFPQTLTDFFALPVDVTWFDPLIEPFTLKMPIINQLKDGIGLMFNQDTRPLIIIYPYQGEDRRITLDWYEPMRLQVRSGLGFIFTILLILSLFKLLSSVFGMGNIGTITKSMKGD